MKETIYTIPVSEVYEADCECPICALKTRFENENAEYYLGPSLMEPDNRMETNEHGFCDRHFELIYNKQINRLGLGLILDTYMQEQMKTISKLTNIQSSNKTEKKSFFSSLKGSGNNADVLIDYLEDHEKDCCICKKLNYTMDRYLEVIFQLYFKEEDFQKRFKEGKGYCLPHTKLLLQASKKYLNASKQAEFAEVLIKMQLDNLSRIEKEVEWFTKKFDYRNNDAPWGNSKDALIRGIKKMSGNTNIN